MARVRKRAVEAAPVAVAEPEPEELEPEAELEPTPVLADLEPAPPAPAATEAEREDLHAGGLGKLVWRSGLGAVAAVARRELGSYFLSPVGWVIATLMILPVSVFGYVVPDVLNRSSSMDAVFGIASFLMLFFVPAFTMRLFAEERRQGTLEMLLTQPVRDWEAVVGKWLGAVLFYLFTVAFTLAYVALLAIYAPKVTIHAFGVPVAVADLDWGLILSGYLGLVVIGATFSAVGVLTSSLTSNQIIALVAGWVALLMLWYLGGLVDLFTAPPLDQFFAYIAGANRYDGFNHGLIQLKDIVYFATITVGCLFLATRVLESRRWRS